MIHTPRIKCIDIAKGIGILLVIIGHVLPGTYLAKVIYSFHMPLFFFLSGVCYNRTKFSFYELVRVRLRTLFFPLLLFSCLVHLVDIFILSEEFSMDDFFPNSLWFVFILLLTELLGYFLVKLPPLLLLAIGFGGTLLYYFGVSPVYSLTSLPIALMFYCIGNLMKEYAIQEIDDECINYKEKVKTVCCICGGVIVLLLYSYIHLSYLDMRLGVFPVESLIIAPIGIYITIILSKWIEKTSIQQAIVFLGKNTFVIMAVHEVFLSLCVHYLKPNLNGGNIQDMILYKMLQQIIMWSGIFISIWFVNNKTRWMIGKSK